MEAMTRDEDQSCQALKAAWMKKTASRTIARARFEVAGGSPRGFQAMKTRIDPTSRMEPKPLKKYPNIVWKKCVGGRDGVFLPYCARRRLTCSEDRPWFGELDNRE